MNYLPVHICTHIPSVYLCRQILFEHEGDHNLKSTRIVTELKSNFVTMPKKELYQIQQLQAFCPVYIFGSMLVVITKMQSGSAS